METSNNTQTSNKINPIATGIAGVVIGAGITAAAAALQDKKTQQKVKNALKMAGTKAVKYCDQLTSETKKTANNGIEKVQEDIKDIKDSKNIKDIKKEAAKAL